MKGSDRFVADAEGIVEDPVARAEGDEGDDEDLYVPPEGWVFREAPFHSAYQEEDVISSTPFAGDEGIKFWNQNEMSLKALFEQTEQPDESAEPITRDGTIYDVIGETTLLEHDSDDDSGFRYINWAVFGARVYEVLLHYRPNVSAFETNGVVILTGAESIDDLVKIRGQLLLSADGKSFDVALAHLEGALAHLEMTVVPGKLPRAFVTPADAYADTTRQGGIVDVVGDLLVCLEYVMSHVTVKETEGVESNVVPSNWADTVEAIRRWARIFFFVQDLAKYHGQNPSKSDLRGWKLLQLAILWKERSNSRIVGQNWFPEVRGFVNEAGYNAAVAQVLREYRAMLESFGGQQRAAMDFVGSAGQKKEDKEDKIPARSTRLSDKDLKDGAVDLVEIPEEADQAYETERERVSLAKNRAAAEPWIGEAAAAIIDGAIDSPDDRHVWRWYQENFRDAFYALIPWDKPAEVNRVMRSIRKMYVIAEAERRKSRSEERSPGELAAWDALLARSKAQYVLLQAQDLQNRGFADVTELDVESSVDFEGKLWEDLHQKYMDLMQALANARASYRAAMFFVTDNAPDTVVMPGKAPLNLDAHEKGLEYIKRKRADNMRQLQLKAQKWEDDMSMAAASLRIYQDDIMQQTYLLGNTIHEDPDQATVDMLFLEEQNRRTEVFELQLRDLYDQRMEFMRQWVLNKWPELPATQRMGLLDKKTAQSKPFKQFARLMGFDPAMPLLTEQPRKAITSDEGSGAVAEAPSNPFQGITIIGGVHDIGTEWDAVSEVTPDMNPRIIALREDILRQKKVYQEVKADIRKYVALKATQASRLIRITAIRDRLRVLNDVPASTQLLLPAPLPPTAPTTSLAHRHARSPPVFSAKTVLAKTRPSLVAPLGPVGASDTWSLPPPPTSLSRPTFVFDPPESPAPAQFVPPPSRPAPSPPMQKASPKKKPGPPKFTKSGKE